MLGPGAEKVVAALDEKQASRLARLARQEDRSQAEVLREALAAYQPAPSRNRHFALAAGFPRIGGDSRPVSHFPNTSYSEGFGS